MIAIMIEIIKENQTTIITAIASIISGMVGAIIVSYRANKTIISEIEKQKVKIYTSHLEDEETPTMILNICENLLNNKSTIKETMGLITEKQSSIISYASDSTIQLLAKMKAYQQENEESEFIACAILLFCNIKYDTTGIKTSPKTIYNLYSERFLWSKLKNYEIVKDKIRGADFSTFQHMSNQIIEETGLPSWLKISKVSILKDKLLVYGNRNMYILLLLSMGLIECVFGIWVIYNTISAVINIREIPVINKFLIIIIIILTAITNMIDMILRGKNRIKYRILKIMNTIVIVVLIFATISRILF